MKRRHRHRLHLGVFVPGLPGGVDAAAEYIFGGHGPKPFATHIIRTKGPLPAMAPIRFTMAVCQVVWLTIIGRLDAAHVNVSVRGSTARKVVLTAILRLLRIRYTVQVHSGRYPQFWRHLRPWTQQLIRPMFTQAEAVIVLGRCFEKFVTDDLGVDLARVVVVPNGVPVPPFTMKEPAETPKIVYVGRLDDNKGYLRLLEALSTLRDSPWTAELVGDGEVSSARDKIIEYAMVDRIRVRAWSERTKVSSIVASSNIFVLPSRSEGLSLSLLEAMANGLACITSPAGAHRELILNEINGLLVAPTDTEELAKAIRRLIDSAHLRTELGAAAREHIEAGYSVSHQRRRYEQLYAELFSSGQPSRGSKNAH